MRVKVYRSILEVPCLPEGYGEDEKIDMISTKNIQSRIILLTFVRLPHSGHGFHH